MSKCSDAYLLVIADEGPNYSKASNCTALAASVKAAMQSRSTSSIPVESVAPLLCPIDSALVNQVLAIFPEASPDFVKTWCRNNPGKKIDQIIDMMLSIDYERRAPRVEEPAIAQEPEEQMEMLQALFPDADPTYLQQNVEQLDEEGLKEFIEDCLTNRNYPTMKDYLR